MTYSQIKSKVYLLTKTNNTSFPVADLTIQANNALERVVALINKADQRWQWDDTNQTDLPIATTTITSGQKDYSLATIHLSIDRIEVKDLGGNWHLLRPLDQHNIGDQALLAYKSVSGLPEEYDIVGSSIFLYPTPNYTQAASLKIYFTRGPVLFATTDTTLEPGFNSLFHDLIPLWVSYEYALANSLSNAPLLLAEITRKEQELEDFYGQRNRYERPRMTVSNNTYGAQSGRFGRGTSDSNK